MPENSLSPLPTAVQAILDQLIMRSPHLQGSCPGLIRAYQALADNFQKGGILYLCGNGGSFADCIHIKGELAKQFEMKRPLRDPQIIENLQESEWGELLVDKLEAGLPVVVLGESHALRSAFENDKDPVLSYAQELYSFIGRVRPGVFMGLSTSGGAKNVNAALALAQACGLVTISFTGPKGGTLARAADIDWRAPGATTALIQENQIALYHTLCQMLEARFFA